MPLVNTWDYNPYRLKFNIPCWAMTTTVLFFIFGGWTLLDYTQLMLKTGINAKNVGTLIEYNIFVFFSFIPAMHR